MKVLTYQQFADQQAQAGRFSDQQDLRQHWGEQGYNHFLNQTEQAWIQYVTDEFPNTTVRELAQMRNAV